MVHANVIEAITYAVILNEVKDLNCPYDYRTFLRFFASLRMTPEGASPVWVEWAIAMYGINQDWLVTVIRIFAHMSERSHSFV